MEHDTTRRVDAKVDRAQAAYRRRGVVVRFLWVAVAMIVIAAGLAMTVFPGPSTVVVPAGLAMLAAAFGWARRLLRRSIDRGVDAEERFAEASRPMQALAVAVSACLAGAVVALVLL